MATLGPCLAKGGVDPTSLLLVSVLPSEDGASIEYRMREGSVDFHATARRSTPDIGVDEAGAKLKGMWCTLSKQPFVLTGGDKIVPALGRPFWRIAFLAGRIPYEAAVDAETSKVLWIEWNAGPGAGPTPFPDEKVARTRWEIEQDVLRYVNLVRQGRPVALHGIGPPIRGVVLARFDTAVNGLRTFPETCGLTVEFMGQSGRFVGFSGPRDAVSYPDPQPKVTGEDLQARIRKAQEVEAERYRRQYGVTTGAPKWDLYPDLGYYEVHGAMKLVWRAKVYYAMMNPGGTSNKLWMSYHPILIDAATGETVHYSLWPGGD